MMLRSVQGRYVMRSLEELAKKALELKERGMSTYEIADELKVQADTVVWLLLHGKDGVKTRDAYDVYVNWNPIGSSVRRLTLVGRAMADMVHGAVASWQTAAFLVCATIDGDNRNLIRLYTTGLYPRVARYWLRG